MNLTLKVKLLTEDAVAPRVAHPGFDLGYDLYSNEEHVALDPGQQHLFSTGVAVQFPAGYGGIIKDRSSMAVQKSLYTAGGVIDNGYTGEIKIILRNGGLDMQRIYKGNKIAQLVIVPVLTSSTMDIVEDLSVTARGEGGFGSTGI